LQAAFHLPRSTDLLYEEGTLVGTLGIRLRR
jgi:hypothetical protein